jgi:uncharacterized OsmC-like protein
MNKRMEFRLIFHFPFDICHCLILFNNKIERYISLGGWLSGEQKARLLEMAQRCPVHKTLTSEISIKDFLD